MLYYSEILKKNFTTPEECVEKEEEYKAKIEAEKAAKEALAKEKESRIKEVEVAYNEAKAAEKKLDELRAALFKDYGLSFRGPVRIDPWFAALLDVFDID